MSEGNSTNTLILSSPDDPSFSENCFRKMGAPGAGTNFLGVTLTQSIDENLASLQTHVEFESSDRVAFIDVGGRTRSADSAVTTIDTDENVPVSIETLSSPSDLTSLGVAITNQLSAWADNENHTTICFDSITPMFQYVDLNQVYQFFHVLTAEVRATDASGQYHIDPTAHDDREINTMKLVFDEVVEPTADDSIDRPSRRQPSASAGSKPDHPSDGDRDLEPVADASVIQTSTLGDRRPSVAVTNTIADVEGVEPEQLPRPLKERVDPEAIDAVVSSSTDSPTGDVRIEFTWLSYRITLDHEAIQVRDLEELRG